MKLSELDNEILHRLDEIEKLGEPFTQDIDRELLNLIREYMARATIDIEIQNALFNHDQE